MKIYNASDYGVKPYVYCEKALENFLSSIPQDEEEKTIVLKKFTPLYLFLLLGIINTIIIYLYPTSFMVGYIICLVVISMNFTIENPDVKMLEQVEMSKKRKEPTMLRLNF